MRLNCQNTSSGKKSACSFSGEAKASSSLLRTKASLTGHSTLGAASGATPLRDGADALVRLPTNLDPRRVPFVRAAIRTRGEAARWAGAAARRVVGQRRRGWRTRSCSAWPRSAAATARWWTETSSTCGGATWIEPGPHAYQSIEDNEVYLPNDEIWTYDIDSGLWRMHLMEGELPTSMSGSCGACINGKLYVFGGYDDKGYSNRLYFVNLRTRDGTYVWKKITNFEGQPPTPRDKLSCWVYKDRLIYFGGYGCRRHNELQDCFDVHDASWEEQIFWGWHNDVHVFDTKTQTWFQPEIKQTRMNDLHSLNLDTWTWSGRISINGESPKHRSWHTLTPIADDKLFLFGGLSADNIPLSDGWIHNTITNCWKQLIHLPNTRPRLWHTACLGKENEIMVFGGSKDDLLSLDTGHCNDLLIFQTQPYSLLRSCLDCIGKNAIILKSQISLLPPKLLQQVLKKITFWTAANHREEQRAQKDETENKYQWISSN
ncbi:kelch domain-containing protein 1 isoform X2 [Ictidomys tridecemlineatus]